MTDNATLRTLSGEPDSPASLAESTLILIDCQNTYTRGVMELAGVQAALDEIEVLLDRARTAGIPVLHIQQLGEAGSPYDVEADIGRIVTRVEPHGGEHVIRKEFPNAFVGTDLHDRLSAAPGRDLVLAGFMTHMCVNSTARGAYNLGYRPSVVAGATATRSLPGPDGTTVDAATLQVASLAGLADMFAVVVPDTAGIPD